MSSPDDLHDDMLRNSLDDATAERLVTGALHPEDAPPGYAEVATLMTAARASTEESITGRDAAVSSIAAAIRSAPGPARERHPTFSKFLTLKALGIALPVMALTAGSAAAATGSLPGHAQSAVSLALSHIGVSVPSGTAVGPDPTGPSRSGLCTAYEAALAHGQASDRSTAFASLAKAAGGAGNISAYCAGTTAPSNTTDTNHSGSNGSIGSEPSARHRGSSSPGSPSSTPPLSTSAGNAPASTPAGPPSSTPAGNAPASTPAGPPAGSH